MPRDFTGTGCGCRSSDGGGKGEMRRGLGMVGDWVVASASPLLANKYGKDGVASMWAGTRAFVRTGRRKGEAGTTGHATGFDRGLGPSWTCASRGCGVGGARAV